MKHALIFGGNEIPKSLEHFYGNVYPSVEDFSRHNVKSPGQLLYICGDISLFPTNFKHDGDILVIAEESSNYLCSELWGKPSVNLISIGQVPINVRTLTSFTL